MHSSLSDLIRKKFEEKERLTLKEIADHISNLEIKFADMESTKLHHSIRRSIQTLVKTGYIRRVAAATYKRN